VMRKEDLQRALRAGGGTDLRSALVAAGITVRKPEFSQYPFQFDHFLTVAGQVEQNGDWQKAASIYDYIGTNLGNTRWMRTLKANALYHAGRLRQAAETAGALNNECPTVARLLIEARAYKKMNRFEPAIDCYRRAKAILEGNMSRDNGAGCDPVGKGAQQGLDNPLERRQWIH
jgi:tetratricopeptide (TPR) repeat protein